MTPFYVTGLWAVAPSCELYIILHSHLFTKKTGHHPLYLRRLCEFNTKSFSAYSQIFALCLQLIMKYMNYLFRNNEFLIFRGKFLGSLFYIKVWTMFNTLKLSNMRTRTKYSVMKQKDVPIISRTYSRDKKWRSKISHAVTTKSSGLYYSEVADASEEYVAWILTAAEHSKQETGRSMRPAWLAWLALRPWRRRWNVSPKSRALSETSLIWSYAVEHRSLYDLPVYNKINPQ
jgi:hypothetical protein